MFTLFFPDRNSSQIEGMVKDNNIQGLIRLLAHRDFNVRWKAASALGRIGQAAIDPLIPLLDIPNKYVRIGAIETLGELRAEAAVPALSNLLEKERYPELRWAAALALGKIGDKKCIPFLINGLKDKDKYARFGAAVALDRLDWYPQTMDGRTYYLIAKQDWDSIHDVNTVSTDALIHSIKDRDLEVKRKIIEKLGELEVKLGCKGMATMFGGADEHTLWIAVQAVPKCHIPEIYIPMGITRRVHIGKNPWVVALLNCLFLGGGYSYLGFWWGKLLTQINLSLIVVTSLLIGPVIPTVVSYFCSTVLGIHSWFIAREMLDRETDDS
jgi:hypothetical protein